MRFDRMKSLSAAPERAPSPKISDRRISKPLIEKKRRARINASLSELKTLLEVVLGEEVPRESKMEKADILELAVKHVRDVNRRQLTVAATADPSVLDKYRVGYSECATEIGRYLNTVDSVEVELRSRLLGHLSNCIQGLKHDQDCRPRPFMSMIPNPAVIQQANIRPQPQYQNIVRAPMMQQQQPIKTSPVVSMQKLPVQQPMNGHRAMHLNTLQNGPLPTLPHGQETVPGGVILVAQPAPERLSPIYVNTVSPKNFMSTEHFMQSARVQRSPDFIKAKQISPIKPESGLLTIDVTTLHMQKSVSPVHHFVQSTPMPVPDAKVWRPW